MAAIIVISTNFRLSTGASAAVGTAGEALDAFELVYLKASDNKLWLASNATSAEAAFYGIVIQGAAADGFVSYVPASAGVFIESAGTPWTKGSTYIMGDVAGQMMDAADAGSGDFVTVVGTAVSTSKLQIVNAQTGVSV